MYLVIDIISIEHISGSWYFRRRTLRGRSEDNYRRATLFPVCTYSAMASKVKPGWYRVIGEYGNKIY